MGEQDRNQKACVRSPVPPLLGARGAARHVPADLVLSLAAAVGVCSALLKIEASPIDSKPLDSEMAGFQAIQAAISAHGIPVFG